MEDVVQLDQNYSGPPSAFEKELTELINKHSMEGQSEIPDFVLAKYLHGCLTNFAVAVLRRDQWYHFNQKLPLNSLDNPNR
jgi:hypothetical protein